jgi:hypothetical protein
MICAIQQAASKKRNYLLSKLNNGKQELKQSKSGCQNFVKIPKKGHLNHSIFFLQATLLIEKNGEYRSWEGLFPFGGGI